MTSVPVTKRTSLLKTDCRNNHDRKVSQISRGARSNDKTFQLQVGLEAFYDHPSYNASNQEGERNVDRHKPPGNHVLERNGPGETGKDEGRSEDGENQLVEGFAEVG